MPKIPLAKIRTQYPESLERTPQRLPKAKRGQSQSPPGRRKRR